jgi:uncharacterized delta-60 repeat protein
MKRLLARAAAALAAAFAVAPAAHAAFGDVDCSFGTNGTLTISGASGQVFGMTPEPAGSVLLRAGPQNAGFVTSSSQLYRIDAYGGSPTLVGDTVPNAGVTDPIDALQADGKIVFPTGQGNGSGVPAGLVRYLAAGGVDTSFGTNGYASLAGFTAATTGAWIQTDGRIVVGGTFNGHAALVRFNANGTVDATYGSSGAAANTNPAVGSSYQSIAMQPDGSVVAMAFNALYRYRTDGQLDTTFGSGGSVNLSTAVVQSYAVRVQPSGKIVVLGTNGTFNQMRVARYTSTGSLDTSIGSGAGFRDVRFNASAVNYPYAPIAMTMMPDGRPIIVGTANTSVMIRWSVDLADEVALAVTYAPSTALGLADGRFLIANANTAGQVRAYLGVANASSCNQTTTAVTSSPNPSITGQSVTITTTVSPVSGTNVPTGSVLFKAGSADLGLPVTLSNGIATFTTSQLPDGANTLTAIYTPATGSGFIGSTSAPYTHTVNPRPATSVTLSSSPNPSALGQTLTLTAVVNGAVSGTPTGTVQFYYDGLPIAAGVAMTGGSATMNTPVLRAGTHSLSAAYSGDASFSPSTSSPISQVVNPGAAPGVFGDRDCNFGNNGVSLLTTGFNSTMNAAADSDGTLVVRVGQDIFSGLQRVGWLGNALSSFNNSTQGGNLNDPSDVLQPDRKILYAIGAISTSAQPFGGPPGVGRVLSTGAIDTSFGNSGTAILSTFASMGMRAGPVLQGDGRILVSGINGSNGMIVRLNADGSIDTTFGSGGTVNGAPALSIALQADGRIVALGATTLARYLSNGQPDTSFGTGGSVNISGIVNGQIVRLQSSGQILVAGTIPGASPAPLRLARFTAAGALDSSTFGGTGYRDVTIGGTPVTTPASITRYVRPLTVMPDDRPMIVTTVQTSPSSPATGVLIRYGADLSDDAAVSLDFAATFVTVLPDGKFLLGRYATAELHRLLDVSDPPSCVATTTSMTSSPNPSDFAQPVTLTATVASSGGTPTGAVQFRNGSTFVGSPATLSNGVATLVTSSLPSGTLSLSALYTGQGSFAASASAPVTQVVHTALTINDPTANLATDTSITFTVTLTSALATPVTVDFTTADNSATAGVDYVAQSGTLTFAPGETTKTITVTLTPRSAPQTDRNFFILLSNPTNTTLAKTNAIGTIVYVASGALSLFVDDPVVLEGYSGITLLGFTVSLSQPSFTTIVKVNYATSNGTGTAGIDFTGVSGTITFGNGETKHFVMVPILANATQQSDRTLFVNLSGAIGATIVKAQGTGTIQDDDPAPAAATIAQYRLYSPITNEHLYTTDTNEYAVLGTRGWVQEGVAYTMFKDGGTYGTQYPIPLYRMYHGGIQQHHWTTDSNEVMVLVGGGAWSYEGIAGYVLPNADTGTTSLYRLSYATPPLHLWTTDLNEKDTLVAVYGWRYEGVVGEVLP